MTRQIKAYKLVEGMTIHHARGPILVSLVIRQEKCLSVIGRIVEEKSHFAGYKNGEQVFEKYTSESEIFGDFQNNEILTITDPEPAAKATYIPPPNKTRML